jgi:uncharacterized membrane protein YhhN
VTTGAWVLLGVAAVAAVVDWVAVAFTRKGVEYLCKPAATLALIGVAATIDPRHGDVRTVFLVALVFSLTGDVALMLPGDHLIPGLVSFLFAHVAFTVGFALHGGSGGDYALGVAVVAAIAVPIALRIVRALTHAGRRELVFPVIAYVFAIGAMVVSAIANGNAYAIAGAALFFVSDTLIAEQRFVGPRKVLPVAIMVTYHLALAGLVLSLLP